MKENNQKDIEALQLETLREQNDQKLQDQTIILNINEKSLKAAQAVDEKEKENSDPIDQQNNGKTAQSTSEEKSGKKFN